MSGAICLGLTMLLAGDAAAQESFPAPGGVYSSAVVSAPGATLVVAGNILGRGETFEEAALSALREAEARIAPFGLDRRDIVRVRAAVAPGADAVQALAEWNRGWQQFFGSEWSPARSTVIASGLTAADAKFVLDITAASGAGSEAESVFSGGLPTTNPNLRVAGPAESPVALVSTRAGLALTSGFLPTRSRLTDPESMEQQIGSAWERIGEVLEEGGLGAADVFFVRTFPSEQPGRSGVDFAAWDQVYRSWMAAGHTPAQTSWAGFGFRSRAVFVELESWAVPRQRLDAPPSNTSDNPLIWTIGGANSAISNLAVVAPEAELLWVSGVIAPQIEDMHDEAVGALLELRRRLQQMGASLGDVAEMRVFFVAPDDVFEDHWTAWNEAYARFFNHPQLNPHRPVRTAYSVEGLPAGRKIMIEAIVVRPPN